MYNSFPQMGILKARYHTLICAKRMGAINISGGIRVIKGAGSAPERVRKPYSRQKYFASAGNRT